MVLACAKMLTRPYLSILTSKVHVFMQAIHKFFAFRTCGYSPLHRLFEVLAILTFFGCSAILALRLFEGLTSVAWTQAAWVLSIALILGYLAADFVSGFVHWMGDTFGDENTPVLGMSFVKPFRDHHVDPLDITRHDFIEVNGNNSIVLLMVLIPVVIFLPRPETALTFFMTGMSVSFVLGIFMTNQFHKWSHLEERPMWMVYLHRSGLILPPQHHDVHHTAPHDTYYCITCGWMNPILARIGFFEKMESLVRGVLRMPKTS